MATNEEGGLRYQPRPRPEWVRGANAMGRAIDAKNVVPLDERSLLEAAMANTGLSDFGDDAWREPFRILLSDLERHANLHLVGRLMTRSDLLVHLEGRLRVIDWYKAHPEVAAERVEAPVFVVGLPRSGTTIMEEILGADPKARSVRMWEAKFPCPPPHPDDPKPDPRIARAEALVGLQDAITPEWASMHKVGGDLPVECIEFTYASFVSYAFSASFHVPNYTRYVAESDHRTAFEWHEKILKLLQSTGRPHHWLLKGPTHLPVLPALLERYPDARLVLMLRDPVKATASVVDVSGTLFYMRSDDTSLNKPHGQFIDGHPAVHALQRVIDWIEAGTIARDRIVAVPYLDFFADPERGLERLYAGLGLPLDDEGRHAMLGYIANKPKDKFGHHDYAVGDDALIASERAKWRAIQDWFAVKSEL